MFSLVLGAGSPRTMLTTMLILVGSCTLVFVFGLWISLFVWVWRDSRARTADRRFQYLFTVLVALLFLGGLCIYLLLRPRRTLAQDYAQQVEEEALLAELAERCTCTTCQMPLGTDFQVCPTCGSVVKRRCPRCRPH